VLPLPTFTIFYAIEKAIKTYRKFAQKQLGFVANDITLDQALLLLLIHDRPGLSQVRLAEILFKEDASMTRMINSMVRNGYLCRRVHATDKRRSQLSLSAKGLNILEVLRPVIAQNRETALAGISPGLLDHMRTGLRLLTENCEIAAAQPCTAHHKS